MLAPADGFWLWNRMDDLGGVEWPRIWDWESGGLPSDGVACRHNFAILGQDYFSEDRQQRKRFTGSDEQYERCAISTYERDVCRRDRSIARVSFM